MNLPNYSSEMNLTDYVNAQIASVEHIADQQRRLITLRGYPTDTDILIRILHNNPYLKGVSVREINKEILSPGWFRLHYL